MANLEQILAQSAADPQSMQAFVARAETVAEFRESLAMYVRNGQEPFASQAWNILQQVSPEKTVSQLQSIVTRGGGYAQQAFTQLVTAAETAVAGAREAMGVIARSGSQFAKEAADLIRRHGWSAVSAAGGAVQAVKTAARRPWALVGLSFGAWLLLGAGIAAIGIGGYIYSRGDAPVGEGPRMTGEDCPPLTRTAQKCPWSPDGYEVKECTPGFCWDAGPQGALACKQANDVANAGRTYTSDLVCHDGFEETKDPCTGVILSCNPKQG